MSAPVTCYGCGEPSDGVSECQNCGGLPTDPATFAKQIASVKTMSAEAFASVFVEAPRANLIRKGARR